MSKKQKGGIIVSSNADKQPDRLVGNNSIVTGQQPRARSRTFTAKQCTTCTALRAANATVKPEDNFTRVIATRGNVRYCRCYYCGNTWKDSDA